MAQRTKYGFAEEIMISLRDQFVGRDLQVDMREIVLKLDQLVNEFARQGWLENWKMNIGGDLDEMYLTTWDNLTVTDPTNKMPSYVTIPAHYVSLPKNQGINQVSFTNDFSVAKKKYFDPIIITSFKDQSTYRNTVGEYLEERISCYPKNGILYFDRGNIFSTYGTISLRLVVRDSSAIADDAPYPIDAAIEKRVINELVAFYRERMAQPQDNIKDAQAVESSPLPR